MFGAMEQQGREPESPAGAKRERVRFGAFTFTRSPAGRSLAQVELEHGGKTFVGRAEGPSSPVADLRLGAEAAIQALQTFVAGGLGMDVIGVKLVRAFDANVAIVSLARRSGGGAHLVGCCLADREPVRAAALSVLNATNRLVENYIASTTRARIPETPAS